MPQTINTGAENYATWLQARMDEKGLTQRQLAKLLRPDSPETARRAVRRYLRGMVPTQRSREAISGVLGTADLGPDESAEDD